MNVPCTPALRYQLFLPLLLPRSLLLRITSSFLHHLAAAWVGRPGVLTSRVHLLTGTSEFTLSKLHSAAVASHWGCLVEIGLPRLSLISWRWRWQQTLTP